MRYWILVVLLNGIFALVMHFAAPEMFGSAPYYAGVAICVLIAGVITWRDPPDILDKMLIFVIQWGALCAGVAFAVWGAGYKLNLWGEHNSGELVSSVFDTWIPNLAILTGIVILFSVYLRIRNR
ncbi:hypothetical protein AB5E31_005061 [Salmonella enterica]|nr:hypothetical protein [Salmonella enterica]EBV5793271.1 hypothetical protein [Salmonella enterica subsp. enterica serovar Rubislaw]EBV7838498.1 hypothetical protein [Salmonella enterica subsp. enterica serovar Berta]EDD0024209.1 hypothetical protein [Salmonella enterica subsp. enterica serovar Give]EDJ4266708.1 hypothetical protein [Salmonella enterica subsp. enterica serovar Muenchen]EDT1357827.1 hypothetical protein [Salmonella enterica subsp. enterica serovar Braenderup]EDU1831087.1 hypo